LPSKWQIEIPGVFPCYIWTLYPTYLPSSSNYTESKISLDFSSILWSRRQGFHWLQRCLAWGGCNYVQRVSFIWMLLFNSSANLV